MLPKYIEDQLNSTRQINYTEAENFYCGNFTELFDKDSTEYKDFTYKYICYDLVKQAIDTKVDLIWSEKPKITFENPSTQADFDKLRTETNFDEVLKNTTKNYYLYGDSVLKLGTSQNAETSLEDDTKITLYNVNPSNWYPDCNNYNPFEFPKEQTFIFSKTIKEEKQEIKAYLLETHRAGEIIWTSYTKDSKGKFEQVPVLQYFEEEIKNVEANPEKTNKMQIYYNTELTYPLLFFIQNNKDFNSFFGKSDLTLPVISKLWAISEYANLAHKVIVNNTLPPIVLSEKMGKTLNNLIEEYNQNGYKNDITSLADLDLNKDPKKTYSSYTALTSRIYKDMVKKLEVFVDDTRAGEGTHYLRNDYDLEQLRKQHEIFFKSVMTELGISEVLYNPSLSTGAKSGIAYKRMMTLSLNEAENTKRILEPLIKKVAFTILELANKNSVINSEAQMPSVKFANTMLEDGNETLKVIVTKLQNQLLPIKEAIMQANDVSLEQAEQMLLDNKSENIIENNQPTEQSPSSVA